MSGSCATIAGPESTLGAKVLQQQEYLEGQLAGLRIYANNKAGEQRSETTGNGALYGDFGLELRLVGWRRVQD